MWGTDMTTAWTEQGQVDVFVAVDHCSAEWVGIHAAQRGARFQALKPIRHGIRHSFGGFAKDIAQGLAIRPYHGSQYMSDDFQKEIAFLGIESSFAFVQAPEGNGCAERFIRTLKENLFWVQNFRTVESLRQALLDLRQTYKPTCLIERHGFTPPIVIREEHLSITETRRLGAFTVSQSEGGTDPPSQPWLAGRMPQPGSAPLSRHSIDADVLARSIESCFERQYFQSSSRVSVSPFDAPTSGSRHAKFMHASDREHVTPPSTAWPWEATWTDVDEIRTSPWSDGPKRIAQRVRPAPAPSAWRAVRRAGPARSASIQVRGTTTPATDR
jgi:hypothetical protein